MTIDSIRAYCLSFPQTTEKLQWGDNLCFKVRGKIFAILGLDTPRLCFKCAPEIFAELLEREHVRPAPYLARYKWVLVECLGALGDAEFEDLIRQSREMVEANAPKGRRSGAVNRRKHKKAKPPRRFKLRERKADG